MGMPNFSLMCDDDHGISIEQHSTDIKVFISNAGEISTTTQMGIEVHTNHEGHVKILDDDGEVLFDTAIDI